jgi:hypothetical protein
MPQGAHQLGDAAVSPSIEELEAYVSGELTESEAEALEESLFRAIPGEAEELNAILRAGALAVENHTWNLVLAPDEREAVLADPGTLFLELPGSVRGQVDAPHLSRHVTRIPVPLEGVRRVDVEMGFVGNDTPLKTFVDLPFWPEDNALWLCCDIAISRVIDGAGPAWVRCVSVEGHGQRRMLFEFQETSPAAP